MSTRIYYYLLYNIFQSKPFMVDVNTHQHTYTHTHSQLKEKERKKERHNDKIKSEEEEKLKSIRHQCKRISSNKAGYYNKFVFEIKFIEPQLAALFALDQLVKCSHQT